MMRKVTKTEFDEFIHTYPMGALNVVTYFVSPPLTTYKDEKSNEVARCCVHHDKYWILDTSNPLRSGRGEQTKGI